MRIYARFPLSLGAAAALLTGCGESQPPIAAPGIIPQSHAIRLARAMVHPGYQVLYSFKSCGKDGESPHAGLIDVNGTLYGTTVGGGVHGGGTVFSVSTSGTEHVLYSFGSPSWDFTSWRINYHIRLARNRAISYVEVPRMIDCNSDGEDHPFSDHGMRRAAEAVEGTGEARETLETLKHWPERYHEKVLRDPHLEAEFRIAAVVARESRSLSFDYRASRIASEVRSMVWRRPEFVRDDRRLRAILLEGAELSRKSNIRWRYGRGA